MLITAFAKMNKGGVKAVFIVLYFGA